MRRNTEPFVSTASGGRPDWVITTIGDAVRIAEGQVDPRTEPFASMPHVGPENIEPGLGRLIDHAKASDLGLISGKYQFHDGDIVYSKIRPYLRKVWLATFGGLSSADMYPLSVNEGFDAGFVSLFLLSDQFTRQVVASQARTGIPKVNREQLKSCLIPRPSVAEQRAITSNLALVQRAIALEDRRISALAELKTATMARCFGQGLHGEVLTQTSLGNLPASWRVRPLGSISQIGNGSTPSRQHQAYWDGGTIPWITSTKVHDIFIRAADEFVTDLAYRECHLPLVPKGSIVIAITGQGKTLGHAAITLLDTCINQHLAFARITSTDALSEYVLFYLQTRYGDLRRIGLGGGSTKGALTCSFLKTYPIPLPSVIEQREIVDVLGTLFRRLEVAMMRRSVLGELFSASLQQLMTGQLRVTPLLEHNTLAHA